MDFFVAVGKIRLMFILSLFTKIFAMLYTIHKDVELYSMLVKSNLEFSSSYYYILFALQTRVSHSHVNYPLIREYWYSVGKCFVVFILISHIPSIPLVPHTSVLRSYGFLIFCPNTTYNLPANLSHFSMLCLFSQFSESLHLGFSYFD